MNIYRAFQWHLVLALVSYCFSIVTGNSHIHNHGSTSNISTTHVYHSHCRILVGEIQRRRETCFSQSSTIAEIMTMFSTDYNFMLPFLVHHLSMGFNKIWIYNNDETGLRWYQHPTITCLLRHELIVLQPWPGESVMHRGWEHWIANSKEIYNKHPNYNNIWLSFLDIDEYLLIHHGKSTNGNNTFNDCIGTFLDGYPKVPELSFNWAFFIQKYPLSDFDTSGNIADLPDDHLSLLQKFHKDLNPSNDSKALLNYRTYLSSLKHSFLPFEMNFHRWNVNTHVKSITRLVCLEKIYNQHFGALTAQCPYGQLASNPQGQSFAPTYAVTNEARDQDQKFVYSIAQLNHYWSLSLQDFVRKSHRGHRGVFHGAADQYRSSNEYFSHVQKVKDGDGTFANDTSFMEKYGAWFHHLRKRCHSCFDTKWFDDRISG